MMFTSTICDFAVGTGHLAADQSHGAADLDDGAVEMDRCSCFCVVVSWVVWAICSCRREVGREK